MTAETALKPIYSATQLPTRSPSSTPSLTRQSAERMDAGRRAAKKILSAFPDYGKAPPEYVVNLAESLSYLSEEELAVVLHPLNGVTARTKFLPTFADITAVLQDHRNRQEQFKPAHTPYSRFESVVTPADAPKPKAKFQPYPKLWAAFADEGELLTGHTFETLTEASRSLAMFGKDSARDVLARRVGA